MTNNGIVQIHGKDYMTVARRVELAQESKALEGVETEVLSHDPVVVRAKVTIKGKVYTGISAVDLNSSRAIEKQNPYEVAETSAVGRALGFAGYGLLESIASADEVTRAVALKAAPTSVGEKKEAQTQESTVTCEVCGAAAIEKKGKTKAGKQYHGIFCSTENRSHTRWLWN
jgi:hypothetical protein